MATTYNPRVVTDGLILYYDMGNTRKSWLGKPTTNLGANLDLMFVHAGHTVTYIGMEDGWKKYSMSGTWSQGTYPYFLRIGSVNFTGGVSYSTALQMKTNVPQKFEYFGTQGVNYVNDPMNLGGTQTSTIQSDGSVIVTNYNFQYTGNTFNSGYLFTKPLANGTVFDPASDFVWMKNCQVEQGTFGTPYTSGTRSTSNSIIDLTGINTLTATSLSYASNNTFSFDGTNNYIDLSSISQSIGTVITWVRPSLVAGDYVIFGVDANGQDNWLGINGGKIYMLFTESSDVNNNAIVGNTTLSNNIWYQIACTIAGNTAKIYLNSVEDGTSTVAFTIGLWTGTSAIGRRGGLSQRYFPGTISNVQLYNRALSAAEIKQNFNALRGRFGI